MTLPLTPEMLRAAYDYLNTTPPFSRWNLPDGEDVVFHVVRDRAVRGWYQWRDDKHHIAVSSRNIGYTSGLMDVMAHEMVHLHERHCGACGSAEHSAAFHRWAGQVCRIHGFDPKAF
jgi:hypothetical protein